MPSRGIAPFNELFTAAPRTNLWRCERGWRPTVWRQNRIWHAFPWRAVFGMGFGGRAGNLHVPMISVMTRPTPAQAFVLASGEHDNANPNKQQWSIQIEVSYFSSSYFFLQPQTALTFSHKSWLILRSGSFRTLVQRTKREKCGTINLA